MGFYAALLFLTRLPLPQVKLDEKKKNSFSFALFPLAGGVIGGILTLIYIFGSAILPKQVLAGIIVIMNIIITGGMHLDGPCRHLQMGFFVLETGKKKTYCHERQSHRGLWCNSALFLLYC